MDEIPDFEGRLKVAKLLETKDDTELKDSLSTIDEHFDAGLSKVSYSIDPFDSAKASKKQRLVK